MWQSATLRQDAKVEVKRSGDETAVFYDAAYEYAVLGDAKRYIYTARLTELSADETYAFRIYAADAASDWEPLLPISDNDTLKMLVFCDSQCVDYSAWQNTLSAATKRFDAPLFTVIGDLTDNGQAPWLWRGWYKAAAKPLRRKVFVPVMGNHECYDLNWLNCLPVGYLQEFSVPANDSATFPGYYYSFDAGPVHFIVLNTQMYELDAIKSGIESEQKIWLKRDVKNHNKPWQIVLMHKDILTYGTGKFDEQRGGINDIGHAFMPLFDVLGIDLVLTGHEHTYRNRGHIFAGKPADAGPYYVMCGLAGDQRYPGLWKNPHFDKVLAPQPETDNYLTLEATGDILRLKCFLPNGEKIDDVTLRKNNGGNFIVR